MRPFNFLAKCQSKTIEEQLEKGVRYFDIRMKANSITAWHGLMQYNAYPYEMLNIISRYAINHPTEIVCYRIVLEETSRKHITDKINKFAIIVDEIREMFPRLKFCGAFCKYKWTVIKEPVYKISFKNCYSSVLGWKGFPYIPYLYAKIHNEKFLKDNKSLVDDNNKVLMMDFI